MKFIVRQRREQLKKKIEERDPYERQLRLYEYERQEEQDAKEEAEDKAYREWAAANPHDHSWLEREALDEFKKKGVRSFNPIGGSPEFVQPSDDLTKTAWLKSERKKIRDMEDLEKEPPKKQKELDPERFI